jgi:hypothetical protein
MQRQSNSKLHASLIALVFCVAGGVHAAAPPVVFHVATNGSDHRKGGPFATVERARDAVRELKKQQGGILRQPVTVYVHGGTYALSQPLRFTAEDSGTLACPVTYAAYRDEKPVLSGGRAITGWKPVTVEGKRLWAAQVSWNFRELWINNQRRTRARHPNDGFSRMTAVPGLDLKAPYNRTSERRFQYAPGDVKPWKNLEDAEIVIQSFWISTRRGVAAVDEKERMVTLNRPSTFRLTDGFGNPPKFARYYIEGAFEFLDSPGEFYLDRKAGTLYYMPLPGEDMTRAQAMAPALEQLVLLKGQPREDKLVEYVTFRGLTFSHAEWLIPADDLGDYHQRQASSTLPAASELWGARNVTIDSCVFAHLGNYSVHFWRGCSQSKVTRCEMYDLGAGGVKVGPSDRNGEVGRDRQSGAVYDHPSERTHHIEVTDNHIHQGSRVFHSGHGIWVGPSTDNLVAHNHIHDFYQIGISVGWTWGFRPSVARNNVIEYNHIHHVGQGRSSDLGAIYTLGPQPGTVIRYNLLHDVEAAEYVGRGVYLDNGSSEIVVEKNIMYNTSTAGYGQSYGKKNVVRNNIMAFGKAAQIEPNGGRPNQPGNSFLFERNLVCMKPDQRIIRSPWRDTEVIVDKNLYWVMGGGPVLFGTMNWEAWQARGMDRASFVADPLFEDPEHFDFRLKPGSPASKIGFEPFDLSGVGPRTGRGAAKTGRPPLHLRADQ